MPGKFLSPEATIRMIELAQNPYRPPQIVKLREEIEGETRAAEVASSISGVIDMARVQKIVGMKLELDRLCCLWAEGEIE
jgi:hypothetical protein